MKGECTQAAGRLRRSDLPSQPHTKTYRLVVNQSTQESPGRQFEPYPDNIFKADLPMYIGEQRESRPVGGKDLLKRMDLIQQFKNRRLSKGKIKLLEAREMTSKSRERKKRAKTELALPKQGNTRHRQSRSTIDISEETLKEHKSYSLISVGQHTSQPGSRDQTLWKGTERQRKSFLDKCALLGEMSYGQMLVEQSGEKYFEYWLRDRWKEEVRAPQFIYQIRAGEHFTENKFINRLRKYRPDIKERHRLLLQGRGLRSK